MTLKFTRKRGDFRVRYEDNIETDQNNYTVYLKEIWTICLQIKYFL